MEVTSRKSDHRIMHPTSKEPPGITFSSRLWYPRAREAKPDFCKRLPANRERGRDFGTEMCLQTRPGLAAAGRVFGDISGRDRTLLHDFAVNSSGARLQSQGQVACEVPENHQREGAHFPCSWQPRCHRNKRHGAPEKRFPVRPRAGTRACGIGIPCNCLSVVQGCASGNRL